MSKSGNFGVVPVLHSVSIIIIIIIIIIIQYLQPCKYCLKRIFFCVRFVFFFRFMEKEIRRTKNCKDLKGVCVIKFWFVGTPVLKINSLVV